MASVARVLSSESRRATVLIVAETATSFGSLSNRLEACGCQCSYAGCYSEAARLLREKGFDLVLCADNRDGVTALVTHLIGSTTSVFRAHAVEDGCWWLPTLRRGEECLGTPALRSSEFARALEHIVETIRCSPERTGALPVPVEEFTLS